MQPVISTDPVEQSYPEAYRLSKTTLEQLQWTDPGWQDSSGALELKDADRLLDPGYLAFEDGYARLGDGSVHCAVLTPLPHCTGPSDSNVWPPLTGGDMWQQMVSWWFGFCDDSDKYRLWHLRDHVEGRWSEGYYRVKDVASRPEGHYVGHSHIVSEYVGGQLTRLHIDFKPPETILDTSRFQEAGVCACLVARVNIRDDPLAGDVAVGHLIHQVRRRPGGEGWEMRSRFWMGHISHNHGGVLPAAVINYIGNTRVGRLLRAPGSLGRDLHRHCYEEMRCLSAILPLLYDKGGEEGRGEGEQTEQ